MFLLLIQAFTAVTNNKHAHKYNNINIYSTGIIFYMYQQRIVCTRNESYINTDLFEEHLICLKVGEMSLEQQEKLLSQVGAKNQSLL